MVLLQLYHGSNQGHKAPRSQLTNSVFRCQRTSVTSFHLTAQGAPAVDDQVTVQKPSTVATTFSKPESARLTKDAHCTALPFVLSLITTRKADRPAVASPAPLVPHRLGSAGRGGRMWWCS